MKNGIKTSVSALALAVILAGSPASATDLKGNNSDPTSAEYQAPANWSGPWIAAVGGYNILTFGADGYDGGVSLEGGFVQGELGYDFQVDNRFVLGAYICASYSAIEGLADGYCVQSRGGVRVTPNTLLFGNVGWRWQGTEDEGEEGFYFSGPVAGVGIEAKFSQSAAVKVGFEHQWITDWDGETVPSELDFGDNRLMVGFVFRP